MANFETFLDLKLDALERSGELIDGTSDYDAICETQINGLYKSLFAGSNEFNVDLGEAWEWAKASVPGLLELIPAFQSGSVLLTYGAVSGLFSSAPSALLGSLAGQFIYVLGRPSFYRIATHVAASASFTLDQTYVEATGASLPFKVIKLDYALLPRIERLLQEIRCYTNDVGQDGPGLIPGIDQRSFDEHYPRNQLLEGVPKRFCLVSEIDGQMIIRFSHYPKVSLRAEYEYIPKAEKLGLFSFATTDVSTGADTLTSAAHGLTNEAQLRFTSTGGLPAGLLPDVTYFASGVTANTFQLKAASGALIDLTTVGSGIHSAISIPKLPHSFRKVLAYAAAHFILVDKSDSRSDYYARQTQATLQAMVSANRKMKRHISFTKGRLLSRLDQTQGTSFNDRIPWIYS